MRKRILLVLCSVLIFFLTTTQTIGAFASYTIHHTTPADQIHRGGEIEFVISAIGYEQSEILKSGATYDNQKLELLRVEPGNLGAITWEDAGTTGTQANIAIHGTAPATGTAETPFARLTFRIIDQVSAPGQGSLELCTLYNPTDNVSPTTSANPTSVPATAVPTSQPTSVQPTVSSGTATPVPTVKPPSSEDTNKLCIPLEINGSPADKMDILFFPSEYAPTEQSAFQEVTRRAIRTVPQTNIGQYPDEILKKMNWYVINMNNEQYPTAWRKALSEQEAVDIVTKNTVCGADRYAVIKKNRGVVLSEGALAYTSPFQFMMIPAEVAQEGLVFPHEWGHLVAGLADEYGSGLTPTYKGMFNCALEQHESPNRSRCMQIQQMQSCDLPEFQTPCDQWNCDKISCTPFMKTLFESAGCFPGCGVGAASRPNLGGLMTTYTFLPDADKFNGPSLHSIIDLTFSNYH